MSEGGGGGGLCGPMYLHSAKGGAVETGCSELYDGMCDFTI